MGAFFAKNVLFSLGAFFKCFFFVAKVHYDPCCLQTVYFKSTLIFPLTLYRSGPMHV